MSIVSGVGNNQSITTQYEYEQQYLNSLNSTDGTQSANSVMNPDGTTASSSSGEGTALESVGEIDNETYEQLIKELKNKIEQKNQELKETKNKHKNRDFLIKDVFGLLIITIIGTVLGAYILQEVFPSNSQNKSQQNAIIQKNTN